jgi:hypothetical protein
MDSLIHNLKEKIEHEEHLDRLLVFLIAILCAIVIGTFSVSAAPWYPSEKLNIKGMSPQTVYVLSDSDTGIAALDVNTRQLKYFNQNQVISRQLYSDEKTL